MGELPAVAPPLLTLDAFVAAHDGQAVDVDGRYGPQCMDLYRRFVEEVLGFPQSPKVPGAADVWTHYLPEFYERITNTPDNVPEPGDVMIWGRGAGQWGHIAIFVTGDARRFVSFDQNWPTGSLAHLQEHTYRNVLGWLRPRRPTPPWYVTYLAEHGIDVADEAAARVALDALFAGGAP